MQDQQLSINNAIIKPIQNALQSQTAPPTVCFNVVLRNGVFILAPFILASSSILLYLDPSATFPRLFLPAAGKCNIIIDDTLGTILAIGGAGANFGVTFFTSFALLQATK